ncbi:RGS domain-containing protein [Chytriomyces sp. MP71]|nr:RGS domain-containing protein [Chytriomyces sp. MP71]
MDPPDVTAFTSESRSRQSSISLQRQESTLNKSIGMETHSSEHTLLSLQNRKRLSRGLSEDDPSRITVHQVLEDRFAPPFSLEDFQNFLKAEHSEENIKFYLALRKYERICSHIPVQLLQSADEVPSDLATRHDFSAAKACISSILEKFFTPGAEDELNVPANLVRDMLRNIKETNNIQPEVFKRIMENVLTMLRLSSFPNFCKLALTEGDCKPKVTVDQVLEDQLPHPMSFSDFHQFLIRERSEEKIEFYLAIKLLRATCENVPKEVLMKSSQQPPDSDYGETIKTAKIWRLRMAVI